MTISTRPETSEVVRTVGELSETELEAGIVARFRTVLTAQPDAVAVADAAEEVTFADLAARAARILAALRSAVTTLDPPATARGPEAFGSREPVAMVFGHDAGAVATLLAVIASGHPVLVLDPRTPAPRLRLFTERAGIRLVLCDEANEATARELTREVLLPLRDGDPAPAELLWQDPPDPTAVAALAFTSGSTGTPKPVANDHRLLMRDAWNSSIASGCYGADDVIAHTLPIAFHAGLTTTVHGLVVGACMRLYDSRSRGIGALPDFLAEHGCTLMISSPAILRAFCASRPDPAKLTSLRAVTIAGESAYGRDIEAVRPLLPAECVVRNRYGSSETGLIAEYVLSPDSPPLEGQLPVGRGVGRTRVDLVRGDGTTPPPGETGTITVTAPSVASGYWELPEATAASFVDNGDGTRTYRTSDLGRFLPDGSLRMVGRTDHSVKVRGYLVDPGEVDAALFALPQVREAVVVGVSRSQEGGIRLVAYVAPASADPSAAAIRTALRGQLPTHMVPEAIVFLEALPRTDRGKIDRSALPPAPAPAAIGQDEQLTHWEELVAVQWAQVLDLSQVRLDDDFFALGGDSLAAEELMTRLGDNLGVGGDRANTGLLARTPVLRDFAQALREHTAPPQGALVTLREGGAQPPVFFVAGGGGLGLAFVPLARRLPEGRPAYALQSPVLESRGLPEVSVRQMARRHVEVVRSVQAHGPYHLVGHSFGGLLALEMAHQLAAAGEDVALLGILDSFPPDPELHPEAARLSPARRARTALGLTRAALRNSAGGAEHWRFFDQAGELGRRYRGRPWPGRAFVAVADSPHRVERAAWGPFLTGSYTCIEAPGDHFTMIRPPFVDDLARGLAEALADRA